MLEGSDRRALARGRRIVSDGGLLPEGLSGPILRSWQRCIDRGLDLFGRPTAEPLTARELSRVIERNERLRAAARPELEALRGDAESTGCIAILTDANGVILDAVGDSSFADRAARVALMPGVAWPSRSAAPMPSERRWSNGRPWPFRATSTSSSRTAFSIARLRPSVRLPAT